MDKTQKEKIRDDREERFRKDFRAGLFKNLLTGLENPFEIEKWWLNELDLAIKETEERLVREILDRIKDTIGINTNSVSDNLTLVKVFDDGGLCDFVDEKEYINKVDLIRFINLIRNK